MFHNWLNMFNQVKEIRSGKLPTKRKGYKVVEGTTIKRVGANPLHKLRTPSLLEIFHKASLKRKNSENQILKDIYPCSFINLCYSTGLTLETCFNHIQWCYFEKKKRWMKRKKRNSIVSHLQRQWQMNQRMQHKFERTEGVCCCWKMVAKALASLSSLHQNSFFDSKRGKQFEPKVCYVTQLMSSFIGIQQNWVLSKNWNPDPNLKW